MEMSTTGCSSTLVQWWDLGWHVLAAGSGQGPQHQEGAQVPGWTVIPIIFALDSVHGDVWH